MPNGFEPQTAFEGYVVGKLEAMSGRLDALPCKMQDERIRDVEQKVSRIEGKASIYGAVMGFVSGLISKHLFGK